MSLISYLAFALKYRFRPKYSSVLKCADFEQERNVDGESSAILNDPDHTLC